MLEKISNKIEKKFFLGVLFIIIFIFVASKVVLKIGFFILIFFMSITCYTKVLTRVNVGYKYHDFILTKSCIFSKDNFLGKYYVSFCDQENIDYCSTLYKNDLEDKLLFSDKIKEIYIENDTLYVVIPKNKKYNIIDKNIIEKISNNKYKLDKKIYNVEYIEIVDK